MRSACRDDIKKMFMDVLHVPYFGDRYPALAIWMIWLPLLLKAQYMHKSHWLILLLQQACWLELTLSPAESLELSSLHSAFLSTSASAAASICFQTHQLFMPSDMRI